MLYNLKKKILLLQKLTEKIIVTEIEILVGAVYWTAV